MKAIILFSGGIDSTVTLALALERNLHFLTLSFDYGQRHKIEIESARQIASYYNVHHRIITIDPAPFASSALVSDKQVPKDRTAQQIASSGIPNTYVPARNTLFMSYALGLAEIENAQEIHIGSNALDHLPYPDCRPEYFNAIGSLFSIATKQAVEGSPPVPVTPLLYWDKTEIIKQGKRLKAPLEMTFSCYDPTPQNQHCRRCDACRLRFAALAA